MEFLETTVQQHRIFDGKIVGLRRDDILLPDGRPAMREVVEHPGGVGILPMTDQHELLMVRQFRYPTGRTLLEIPAGKLERGEDPLACGIRELQEEVGAAARSVVPLGKILASPAYLTEVIHLYLATGLSFTEQHLDDGEFLSIERIPLEQAVQMVMDGEIQDGKTQIAVLKVQRMLDLGLIG